MQAIAIKIGTRPKRLSIYAGSVLAAILGLAGVEAASPAASPNPQQLTQGKTAPHHWYQLGRASWYGKLFQGHETASGESYDMNQLTCAHRSLPLGSLIRVTNLRNNKSVVVRVNDRGPMPENRVIDLSYAAARFLGFSARGTAPVKLELIKTTTELAQLTYPLDKR
jgi:rare lipoprotein A